MNPLEEAVDHIEAVTGQEYGEWPREMHVEEILYPKKEEFYRGRKDKSPPANWILWQLVKKMERATLLSTYYPDKHAFMVSPGLKEHEKCFERTHEVTHGFQRNNCPELCTNRESEEESYLVICAREGIADYIGLRAIPKEKARKLQKNNGKPLPRTRLKTYFGTTEENGRKLDRHLVFLNRYALGLALAEAAVAEADSIWEGLDFLANNPPKTIDEAYEMLETK